MKYVYKTKPYQHQVRALKQLLRQGYGGALLMEPRTGKSKTAIDWLSVLATQRKIDRAVIICPNRVMGTWLNEIMTHCPLRVHVTVWDRDERSRGVPATPAGYQLYLLIVNFNAFGVPGKKLPSGRRSKASGRFKVRSLIYKWLAGQPAACVVDESHKIKSPSGKVSNMIVSMRDAFAYRVILTGTPQTKANRAHDIWMQWQFLNPDTFKEWPTVADFKEEFGRWTNRRGFPEYIGPKNINTLKNRMARDAFIIRRDQCFDLPPREDIVHTVRLNDCTRKIYRLMAEEMVAEIEEGRYAEAPIKLVQSLRLQQITSGFVTDDQGELQVLGLDKLNALEELLEDYAVDKDQKVVVAARWRHDLDGIEGLAKSLGLPVWSIRGGVSRADSDKAIERFREHEGAAVIALQPNSASLGIDLSSASVMVWYSHTLSWVDFSQCCDRIALSRSSTTFIHLVAEKSIDEIVISTLAADGDVGRAIMMNPRELINGHPLDLNDAGQIKGLGTFQVDRKGGK